MDENDEGKLNCHECGDDSGVSAVTLEADSATKLPPELPRPDLSASLYVPPTTQVQAETGLDISGQVVDPKPERWQKVCFLIALVISLLYAVISFQQKSQQSDSVFAVGAMFGAFSAPWLMSAVVALLTSLILMIFRRPFGKSYYNTFAIAVLTLSVLTMLGNLMSTSLRGRNLASIERSNQRDAESIDDVQENMNEMQDMLYDEDGMPKTTVKRFRVQKNPKTTGQIAAAITNSYYNDMLDLQNGYIAALNEAGIESLLEPSRIIEDEDFSESDEMLKAIAEAAETFSEKQKTMVKGFPNRVAKYKLSASQQRAFMKGAGDGISKAVDVQEKNWSLEKKSIAKMAEMIDVLRSSKGYWELQDGNFAFERDADLERFNKSYSELMLFINEQELLRASTLEDANQRIDTIKGNL